MRKVCRNFAPFCAYSILTTARYTHLTSHTNDQANARIDALMNRFTLNWGAVK